MSSQPRSHALSPFPPSSSRRKRREGLGTRLVSNQVLLREWACVGHFKVRGFAIQVHDLLRQDFQPQGLLVWEEEKWPCNILFKLPFGRRVYYSLNNRKKKQNNINSLNVVYEKAAKSKSNNGWYFCNFRFSVNCTPKTTAQQLGSTPAPRFKTNAVWEAHIKRTANSVPRTVSR